MANILGAIGLNESDRLFAGTIGNSIVYDETQRIFDRHNRDVEVALSVFVEKKTEDYQIKYKLAGGGKMQLAGRTGPTNATKRKGDWTVGFPLFDYRDELTMDDITRGYMTVDEYSAHVMGVANRDVNTLRYNILSALLKKTSYTFPDELHGDFTVYPLSNNDSVVYPPLLGASAEAVANSYVGTNYAASAISDTNNPVKTIVDAIEARFGTPTGGSNIAVFYHGDQQAKLEALTDYVKVQYNYVNPGDDDKTVMIAGIDPRLTSASWQVTGTCSGAILCKWANMPTGYMFGHHLDAAAPLIQRVDPASTGLSSELDLVFRGDDKTFESALWRRRYGLGVGNRINGYALQLVGSTTYTDPTIS